MEMNNDNQLKPYVCINCGQRTSKLFHRYKDVIKILHCEMCGEVVDKYVEYDHVIVSLDALLLKKQAVRHILLNSGIQSHWKFGLVFLMCEAVTKLLHQSTGSLEQKSLPDHVLYAALEVDLYWNFFRAAIELFITLFGLLVWTKLWTPCKEKEQIPELKDFFAALLLSSSGKLLALPAIVWGPTSSLLYMLFGALFTVAANIQTTKVLCPAWDTIKVCTAVVIAHGLGFGTSVFMPSKLSLMIS